MNATYHQYLLADGTSGPKFWEIQVVGQQVQTRYGKVGQEKSWTTKDFATPEDALKEAQKKARAKLKKGYEDGTPHVETKTFEELFGELRSLTEETLKEDTVTNIADIYMRMCTLNRSRVVGAVDSYLFQKVDEFDGNSWNSKYLIELRIRLSPCSKVVQNVLLSGAGSVRKNPREEIFANAHIEDAYHTRPGAWIEAFFNADLGYIGRPDCDHGTHPDGSPVMLMALSSRPPDGQESYDVDIMSPKRDPMVVGTDEAGEYIFDHKPFSKWLKDPSWR